MLPLQKLALLCLLCLGMAGCQTVSEPPAPLTTVTLPEAPALGPPAPLIGPPAIIPPVAIPVPPAAVAQPIWPTNWINVWIPLESLGAFTGLGKPIQRTSSPSPTYEFRSTNRVMALRMGSRIAHCDGLECWLGYAPQLIKGLPYIHSLDAQKVVQPLISLPIRRFKPDRTIVIDPGHGGKDGGTKSVLGSYFEKDYTLDWALRLGRLLVTNGWKVILTRTNDTDLSLAERVAVADRSNADLFLSLHFNSGLSNRDLTGIETYCLTPSGMASHLVRTYEDDVTETFPNNAFDDQNLRVAFQLHQILVQSTRAVDRGVRRARFMGVLRGQNRPAVLIEAGYLSNPQEATKIGIPAYRQTLAEALARGLE